MRQVWAPSLPAPSSFYSRLTLTPLAILSFFSPLPLFQTLQSKMLLPVGSSHCEMYECGEKWMANSINSNIPEAMLCYQWHCDGCLMHCLHAQPQFFLAAPTELLASVGYWWWGVVWWTWWRNELHKFIRLWRGLVLWAVYAICCDLYLQNDSYWSF